MMAPPLYEVECLYCKKAFETLAKNKDELVDQKCAYCGRNGLQMVLAGFGGYHITGNNSASVRPKRAGSRS